MAALIFDSNKPTPDCYEFINIKTKGFLANPSLQLFNLINVLEKATLTALKKKKKKLMQILFSTLLPKSKN